MIVHIVAGGPEFYLPNLSEYKEEGDIIWVGVDRGSIHLLNYGFIPDIAVGDFDSITAEEYDLLKEKNINIEKHPPEKDETDMELALTLAFSYNPNRIRIFGATGGRLDHFLGNLFFLINLKERNEHIAFEMIDRKNLIEVKQPGTYKIKRLPDKQYISFIPITKNVENLTLDGFKYPLNNRHIFFGSTLCISNELIYNYGTYSFSKGILLVIRSNDL